MLAGIQKIKIMAAIEGVLRDITGFCWFYFLKKVLCLKRILRKNINSCEIDKPVLRECISSRAERNEI